MKKNQKIQDDVFVNQIMPQMVKLNNLAFRLTGNKDDSEDLIQDFMIKVYSCNADLIAKDNLRPWLTRVLYNTYIDQWRKKKNNPLRLAASIGEPSNEDEIPVFEAAVCDTLCPSQLTYLGQQQKQLTKMLFCLKNEQRVVLIMHDVEGYSLPELSEILGVPLGTLKSRLHRGRAKLRDLLTEEETEKAEFTTEVWQYEM